MLLSNLTAIGVQRQINRHLRHMLSITFDDGFASDHEIVLPILRDNGIRGTFFVNMRDGDRGNHLMTDKQIKELSDEGHEVGCHSNNHSRLTDLSDEEILEEWIENKKRIEEVTGKPVYTHSYPWGDTNNHINHLAGAVFEATRGTNINILENTMDFSGYSYQAWLRRVRPYGRKDMYNSPAIGVDGSSNSTILGFLDEFLSLNEPQYVSLYFHRVFKDDDPDKPSDRKDESEFRDLIEVIADKKEQGLLDIVPFIEGSRRIMTGRSIYL